MMEMLSERNGNGKTAARNEVGDLETWRKRVCGVKTNEGLPNCTQTAGAGVASDTSLQILGSRSILSGHL